MQRKEIKMAEKSASVLQEALIKLDLMNEEAYHNQVASMLDEQPHIMGFLFNLADDFSEEAHDLLVRLTMALFYGMRQTGLEFSMIDAQMLEEMLAKKVEEIEAIDEEDQAFDEVAFLKDASSPATVSSMLEFVADHSQMDETQRNNALLVLSAITELFEVAADIPGTEEKA